MMSPLTIEEIGKIVATETRIPVELMTGVDKRREVSDARFILVLLALNFGYNGTRPKLCAYLCKSKSWMHETICRMPEKIKNPIFYKKVERVMKALSKFQLEHHAENNAKTLIGRLSPAL